ncbi:REP element-mobilizing transposase RayT [Pseudoduganella flava]|uniref:Addiction module toxin RelE n=1 Tax=Pseudoduganella flava TaxID=871742 RepID=A0A562Q373_9BURK|nr:transposase [Pseudoduganella flava]QGZ43209.1 addiction module toxin RelE [Pseudoduganella flava]TWI51169.1 REP element-mobilizing transposase RayT [Pseudoduganella flava]
MARSLRTQYPGALYHITSRGNRRANIYVDEYDYLMWQELLGKTVDRFSFLVHAFCQMPNHFHLLLETVEANLSDGMRYLNGTYGQKFNWRHKHVGHVVQGRFFSDVVNRDAQLLAVSRYIAQNPVRAELVSDADGWRWGSHRHLSGDLSAPPWLQTEWLLSQFSTGSLKCAQAKYRAFVDAVPLAENPLQPDSERSFAPREALSLQQYQQRYSDPNEAMAMAYLSASYTRQEIAEYFGVSIKTVGRAIARFKLRR